MVEVVISLMLVSVMFLLVSYAVTGSKQEISVITSYQLVSNNVLSTLAQLKDEIHESKDLFGYTSAVEEDYLNIVNFTDHPQMLTDSTLPDIAPKGTMDTTSPDWDNIIVGNCIMMARRLSPAQVVFDNDGTIDLDKDGTADSPSPYRIVVPEDDPADDDKTYNVGLYRFEIYYLSETPEVKMPHVKTSLALVKAESTIYADYKGLDVIRGENPDDFSDIVSGLVNTGVRPENISNSGKLEKVEMAWDYSRNNVAEAFYYFEPNGADWQIAATPDATHEIALKSSKKLVGGRSLMSGTFVSISFNTLDDAGDPMFPVTGRNNQTPVFAAEPGAPNYLSKYFPSGFEVMITGPAGARRIFIRLVTVFTDGKKIYPYKATILASSTEG